MIQKPETIEKCEKVYARILAGKSVKNSLEFFTLSHNSFNNWVKINKIKLPPHVILKKGGNYNKNFVKGLYDQY